MNLWHPIMWSDGLSSFSKKLKNIHNEVFLPSISSIVSLTWLVGLSFFLVIKQFIHYIFVFKYSCSKITQNLKKLYLICSTLACNSTSIGLQTHIIIPTKFHNSILNLATRRSIYKCMFNCSNQELKTERIPHNLEL